MRHTPVIGFFFLCILVTGAKNTCAQSAPKSILNTRGELEKLNRKMAYFYQNEIPDSICSQFDTAFTYLPEFKPVITDGGDLRKFFTGWFNTVDIKAYKKNIFEAQVIAGYILETGNFSLRYSTSPGTETAYTGKYMMIWKRNADGKLGILSEIFGSDKTVSPEEMPYAKVEVKENNALYTSRVGEKLLPAIEAYDRDVVKAVLDGDGNARANGFTIDGIYMPHFDRMQIGMKAIRPYMMNTYHPGIFTYDINTYQEVFDTGDFIFLNCAFKVGSDKPGHEGGFTGNMSNLMKRGKDGKLLMYRQLAHNN